MKNRADVAVVGAGILGLAHALVAAREGRSVVLFERHPQARGASVRNFGMIWPISSLPGPIRDRAVRGREVWCEIARDAGIWFDPCGSLHLAYWKEELSVLQESIELTSLPGFESELLSLDRIQEICPGAKIDGLLGGLFSPAEICVDPQQAIALLPRWLEEKYGVTLRFGSMVHSVAPPILRTAEEDWTVDRVVICSGDEFATLYPEVFRESGLTLCKLQMMRTKPQPVTWRMGPMLADGLSFSTYDSFRHCRSLGALRERIDNERSESRRWGVQAKASQNGQSEVTLGDSHEYGTSLPLFDSAMIDQIILRDLKRFLCIPDLEIAQRWHGVYVKHFERSEFVAAPHAEVRVVSACGGNGMTTAFGLAEEVWGSW